MPEQPSEFISAMPEPNGGVFDESLPGGKTMGWLHLEGRTLEFTSVEGRIWSLPLLDIDITKGGVGNRYWFFKGTEAWSLFSDDKTLAKALTAMPETAGQMARWHREGHRGLAMAGAILLVLLAMLAGLWLSRGLMADAVVAKIPVSAEEKLGQVGIAQWEKLMGGFSEDQEAVKQLEALCQPLISALPKNDYKFRFYLSKNSEINAAALPGGYIVVNAGLISAATTPEEIQGVLAHELGHVMKRHSLRQLTGQAGLWLTVGLIFGDQSGWIGFIAGNGALLLDRGFSRAHEREADDFACDLLTKARINPQGMVNFFEMLKKQQDENPALAAITKTLNLASTHPGTEERIETLRRQVPKTPPADGWRDGSVNFNALKLRLGETPTEKKK
jgi:predicted Zn-dependent protease